MMKDAVMMERELDAPIGLDDVAAMDAQGAWCREQYRVDHVCSFLSSNGRELVCAFAAPDAESVRRVLQRVGMPFRRVWGATVHGPHARPAESAVVLVERSFATPVAFDALQAQEDAGAWCLAQHAVRHLHSYFACDRQRMICVYAAPDAEAVRSVQRQVGLPHDRVWAARCWQDVTPPASSPTRT
jgi:hypothetical protein